LSELCFEGPADRLNQTDVSQPALYVCGVAGYRGWIEQEGEMELVGAAGLSLGEYTALHLAGAFDFASGLQLVAKRGRLMQEAAEVTEGSMVALIGADEDQAQAVCEAVLNPRNRPEKRRSEWEERVGNLVMVIHRFWWRRITMHRGRLCFLVIVLRVNKRWKWRRGWTCGRRL